MSKTSKPIKQSVTDERARQILSAYGGVPASWPVAERDEMLRAIRGSESLRATQRAQLGLDRILTDQRDREFAQLSMQKVESLRDGILAGFLARQSANGLDPRNNPERQTGFKWPELRYRRPWVPALAAGLMVLVIGLLIMGNDREATVAELAFERWAWEDVTAQALLPESNADHLEEDELAEFLGLQQDG